MTRFISPDLAGLAPPPAIEVFDFDTILADRTADLAARLTAAGLDDVAVVVRGIENEPLRIGQRTDAYFEELLRQRVNEAVRAGLIATATGLDLDHRAATFYGVARLPLVDEPRPFATNPEDWQSDDTFRAYALLSLEARSTAGPEGSYIFHALEANRAAVLDAACYGEEDGALYADGTAVLAPEVLVVVLALDGDGTPSADLLDQVRAQLNEEEIRPIGDKVTVEPAVITPYAVEIVIRHAPGADGGALAAAAQARVEAYRDKRRRIGVTVQRIALGGAAQVTGVEEIEVISPPGDIVPGSKGAGYCTGITITAEATADSWQ